MKLVVYALCGNEEKMIPWFLDHYRRAGVDKIVIHLNTTSVDGTRKILQGEPLVELHEYDTGGVLRDDIHQKMKNEMWKGQWGSEDWAIVIDCDELLVSPDGRPLRDVLVDLAKQGITVPGTHGYNLIGDDILEYKGASLISEMPLGVSTSASKGLLFGDNGYAHGPYHKPCVFRPAFINGMNYTPGAHYAKPQGKVVPGEGVGIFLIHAKWAFGVGYVINRPWNLSQENMKRAWGTSFLDHTFVNDYYLWARANRKDLFCREPLPAAPLQKACMVPKTPPAPVAPVLPGTPGRLNTRRLVRRRDRKEAVQVKRTPTQTPLEVELNKKDDPKYRFSQDWFSNRTTQWTEWFKPYAGQLCRGIEIGVFEGRSSLWLLENVVTKYESRLFAVDTFQGGDDQIKAGLDCTKTRECYEWNIREHKERVRIFAEPSQIALSKITGLFDFIYIDGSHLAPDVFLDAALSWQLLRVGGRLVFDDYAWRQDKVPQNCPYPAINAFLFCFQDRYIRLSSDLLPQPDLQVAVEKTHA